MRNYMKVSELIEKLQQCPQDAEVVVMHHADWIDIQKVEDVSCKEVGHEIVQIVAY